MSRGDHEVGRDSGGGADIAHTLDDGACIGAGGDNLGLEGVGAPQFRHTLNPRAGRAATVPEGDFVVVDGTDQRREMRPTGHAIGGGGGGPSAFECYPVGGRLRVGGAVEAREGEKGEKCPDEGEERSVPTCKTGEALPMAPVMLAAHGAAPLRPPGRTVRKVGRMMCGAGLFGRGGLKRQASGTALGSRLSALGSRLSALGSRLSALGSRLSALGSRLSALGSRLSALGSRLSALGSRLSALGSRLSALGSRLS